MYASKIIFFSLISLWALPVFSWGANGHRIIGQIAQNNLTEQASNEVTKLIGSASLAQISTWADEIRSDPSWRYTSPWHYINWPPDQTLNSVPRNPKGDVIEAIERFERILRDPREDRITKVNALKFLVHFVADIHQPLHTGYLSDRGGNDISVQWFGKTTNMHAVWDRHILEHQGLSFREFVQTYGHHERSEIKLWQRSTVYDWVQESRDMLVVIYDDVRSQPPSKIPSFSYNYVFKNFDRVRVRLVQAGIRLGGLLNDILG